MSTIYDKDFLKRYLEGKCSEKEKSDFLLWLNDRESKNDDKWMKDIWNGSFSDSRNFLGTEERIFQKLLPHIKDDKPYSNTENHEVPSKRLRYKSKYQILRYAAVVAWLMVAIFAIKYFTTVPSDTASSITYAKKTTPTGQKLIFQLADGSRVTLNSNSSLEYPEKFTDTSRSVILHGEAYFQVSKDPDRPFKVLSGNLVTVALGTSFNIRSDKNETVSLTSGKVMVYGSKDKNKELKVFLDPGEELAYDKSDNTYQKKHFDYKEKIAWKDGVLYFGEDDIDAIVRKIENWYGVTVHLKNKPGEQWYFTGEFKDQSLENVLKGMAYSKGFDYTIEGKLVTLDFKRTDKN